MFSSATSSSWMAARGAPASLAPLSLPAPGAPFTASMGGMAWVGGRDSATDALRSSLVACLVMVVESSALSCGCAGDAGAGWEDVMQHRQSSRLAAMRRSVITMHATNIVIMSTRIMRVLSAEKAENHFTLFSSSTLPSANATADASSVTCTLRPAVDMRRANASGGASHGSRSTMMSYDFCRMNTTSMPMPSRMKGDSCCSGVKGMPKIMPQPQPLMRPRPVTRIPARASAVRARTRSQRASTSTAITM
mmetsp:Transcript_34827/g.88258  ORF Transcript_34827/g.88258 Transcript_34827/m.88258 type:complete len:250 (+) Transcript_34827:2231-2980(+)